MKIKIADCARRKSRGNALGRGFDSHHLHQKIINNIFIGFSIRSRKHCWRSGLCSLRGEKSDWIEIPTSSTDPLKELFMNSTKRKSVLLFFQGALIGTGAILPGVSGGVLCVAFGIYEPMMSFLAHPFSSFKRNFKILLPVIIGGAVGFVLLAKVVELFLSASAIAAMSLFCGLICGTVPSLVRKSNAADPNKGWPHFIIALAVSFAFFNILAQGIGGHIEANFGWYIFCGIIWGLSMVVPGLSSSSILLFMGLYQPMAKGIGDLDFNVLIPLMIGFFAAIAATAKIVNYLLERYYAILSKIILGFVISSVLMIIPVTFSTSYEILLAIGCFAIGFFVSHWMDCADTKDSSRS